MTTQPPAPVIKTNGNVVPGERTVPCNGYTLCCQNDLIILHEDEGDDPMLYGGNIMAVKHPLTGKDAIALRHKPSGGCVYLGDMGCRIHEYRPVICRSFDCRLVFEKINAMPRPERRRLLLRDHVVTMEVYNRGKQLAPTLERDESKYNETVVVNINEDEGVSPDTPDADAPL